ncbi:phosphotransferase [Siminovitchia sp. 179-K 8D1 HS]|uniref:phosphotransferase n=1 Tax=Siminovitchia sp. 179-K 8D1 HS TaxID=3142385 RepID=UPI0039A123E1
MNNQTDGKRDGFETRLLLYIRRVVGHHFRDIFIIKKGVWLIKSEKERWVIKEFTGQKKLQTQIYLTRCLFEHGFMNTYDFHPVGAVHFEDRVFGLIRHLEQNQDEPFHYGSARCRKDALALLSRFHDKTAQFLDMFRAHLLVFDQLNKWEKRLNDFKNKMDSYRDTSLYPYLKNYIFAGEWAIHFMKRHVDYFLEEPHCILHGDVAHHNFIRKKDGSLYLIDFDLISIGPRQIDLLQFCNRILPSLHWSSGRLFSECAEIEPLKNDLPFLAALAYPTDIFREWIYYMNSTKAERTKRKKHLESITFNQYKKRMRFTKTIMTKVENNL